MNVAVSDQSAYLAFRLTLFDRPFDSFCLQASENRLVYPDWALAVLALLIVFAMMPVPVALIHAVLQDRTRRAARGAETGQYRIVSTDDNCETPMTDMSELSHRNGTDASSP